MKKLFRQDDFRRDVAHQKSIVRSQEPVQTLLALPDSLGVGVQTDQLEGVALLEVDANARAKPT
jgi:hypothetical protein